MIITVVNEQAQRTQVPRRQQQQRRARSLLVRALARRARNPLALDTCAVERE
jgi:nitrogen-specific signal transduction histidine kinase